MEPRLGDLDIISTISDVKTSELQNELKIQFYANEWSFVRRIAMKIPYRYKLKDKDKRMPTSECQAEAKSLPRI